jgi:hypothetical protein
MSALQNLWQSLLDQIQRITGGKPSGGPPGQGSPKEDKPADTDKPSH